MFLATFPYQPRLHSFQIAPEIRDFQDPETSDDPDVLEPEVRNATRSIHETGGANPEIPDLVTRQP